DGRRLDVASLPPALLPIDDDRVSLAELGLHPLGSLVVAALQVLVIGGQGCVGDAELLRHGKRPPSVRIGLPAARNRSRSPTTTPTRHHVGRLAGGSVENRLVLRDSSGRRAYASAPTDEARHLRPRGAA